MRVLYVQYTNPGAYPPLVRGAQLLAEAGARVLMLGVRVADTAALDVPGAGGITVREMPAAPNGWRLKAHYARYAAWAVRTGASWRPDWIYASDVLSAPIALALASVTRARLVYHEHDAPSPAHDSWTIRQCLAARRRVARDAAIVVAPNAERAANLSRLVARGRPVLTVWNCPRRSEAGSDTPRRDGPLRVIFRGSINAERLPSNVVRAMARVPHDLTLEVAGYETVGSRGYVAHLLALADHFRVADRVRVHGAVPRGELDIICDRSDIGLALMPIGSGDENMRHMTGASNKVFEYLTRRVTPLVSDLPDWRSTFVDSGYALACDPRDVDSIATAFAWAAAHRAELHAVAERGRERILADWNYETQFAPVLRAMLSGGAHPVSGAAQPEAQCAS
jgi:glycosyltransferase involved in cell wall biosynthesis